MKRRVRTKKVLVTSHLHSHVLFCSEEEYVIVLLEDVCFFVKNPSETSLIYAMSFYKASKLMRMDLRVIYTRISEVEHVSFQLFMALRGWRGRVSRGL